MPLLGLKQDLASKIEATPGTAESLAAAQGTIQVYDIDAGPEVDFTPRPRAGNIGHVKGVTGMRVGRIRYRSECIGGATDPAWGTVYLPGCGYSTSAANGTYKPRSEAPGSNVKVLSHGWYQDGRFASIFGSAGNFDIQCEAGKPIFILWEWMGLWGRHDIRCDHRADERDESADPVRGRDPDDRRYIAGGRAYEHPQQQQHRGAARWPDRDGRPDGPDRLASAEDYH